MEYLGIIIAISVGILTIIAVMLTLFLWTRTESRSDYRHLNAQMESIRELVRSIHDEVKDFHNRLCSIEERRK